MRQYETTFIIDPILSGDEIRQTAQMYVDFLKAGKCEIVHFEETGALQLAYPIKKRTTGAYFWLEYQAPIGSDVIEKMELAFRRDDNVLRYLTIKVDKHRAQFNVDKRAGKFDKKSAEENEDATETTTTAKADEKSAKAKVEG